MYPVATRIFVKHKCTKHQTTAGTSTEESLKRIPKNPSVLRSFLAGMTFAAVTLYVSGWDSTRRGANSNTILRTVVSGKTETRIVLGEGMHSFTEAPPTDGGKGWNGEDPTSAHEAFVQAPAGKRKASDALLGQALPYFDEADVTAVVGALKSYAVFAKNTLAADEVALREGRPLQGKYIVLDTGNELVNRLRGVLSGVLLGVLTDRVFVADITYQQDVKQGLLSALFQGPGYPWDLSKLPPQLARALAPEKNMALRGTDNSKRLYFDMQEAHFQRWVCDDILGPAKSMPVITLSTVVYPLPLIVRNPTYEGHPIFSGASQSLGLFAGGGQAKIEALETLLTRIVLKPTSELRERAREVAVRVKEKAAEWAKKRGQEEGRPPRIVGLHIRTYFVKAVSSNEVEVNLRHFADCATAGSGGGQDAGDTFYFVATDESKTQELARKVWGDGCFFVPFNLPGSKLEGIKAALVDLLVMGSLDDYVMTPHSSFSELASTLSYTWLPDTQASLRTVPIRPIVPLFPQMNEFEHRKVLSLLDRRAAAIVGVKGDGACMRAYAAGMSVAVAKERHISSMFEAIEQAHCMKGRPGIADL